MALGGKVVDFAWLNLLQEADQVGRIRHVTIVKAEGYVRLMWLTDEMINACRVERRGAALYAMNVVTLADEQLGQIAAILPCSACYQCNLPGHSSCFVLPEHHGLT